MIPCRTPHLLLIGCGLWLLGSKCAEANSYSYNALLRGELPSTPTQVAVWSKHDLKTPTIQADQIRRFLKEGVHSAQDPWQRKRSEFRKRTEKAAIDAAKKLGPFDTSDPLPDWRTRELDAFEKEWNALQKRYQIDHRIRGAFLAPENRIFLWQLTSPGVLRIELGGSLCFLELPGEAIAELTFVAPAPPLPLPKLPTDSWNSSRDFLPAIGRHHVPRREVIEAFLRDGRITDKTKSLPLPMSIERATTWKWFPEALALRQKHDPETDPGEILGSGIDGSFACLFLDADGILWRAELQGDKYLQFSDRNGNQTILYYDSA